MTFVLIFSCCMTPLLITFPEPKGSEGEKRWMIINTIVDSLFFIDILVVFNTAIYDQYFQLVENRKTIAKEYL